jgi:hypothetical protein
MECDICRTLAQQLRSYEMEIEDASKESIVECSGVMRGALLGDTVEESLKTRVLYQHHRDTFHVSADDLSRMSHKHVLNVMAENREWNKRLREATSALVNTRLARTITQEEYASRRNDTNFDVAECKRRAGILVKDMAIRERGLVPLVR